MSKGLFAGGDGTLDNPYLIEDAFDLDAVRNGLDKHYKLINDIDLDVAPFNEGKGWIPLGDASNYFIGLLDGCMYTIENLTINRPDGAYQGLFGRVKNATIKNLILKNVNIDAYETIGCVVGDVISDTVLENIGVVSAVVNARILGTPPTGGIAGYLRSSILNKCYFNGTVAGSSVTGGLVGNAKGNVQISNSYTTGIIKFGGGVIGQLHSANDSIVKNCYSSMKFNNTTSSNNGGVIGNVAFSDNITIENCFWDSEYSKILVSQGGTGLTTQQMQTAETFINAGWNINIWVLEDGEHPKLWFERIERYLIKSQNKILTFGNNTWIDTGITEPLTKTDFEMYGVYVSSIIPASKWDKLDDDFEIIAWTENLKSDKYVQITTNPFVPIEKISESNFEVLAWTDGDDVPQIEITIPPFRPLDKLDNQFKIIIGEYLPK